MKEQLLVILERSCLSDPGGTMVVDRRNVYIPHTIYFVTQSSTIWLYDVSLVTIFDQEQKHLCKTTKTNSPHSTHPHPFPPEKPKPNRIYVPGLFCNSGPLHICKIFLFPSPKKQKKTPPCSRRSVTLGVAPFPHSPTHKP